METGTNSTPGADQFAKLSALLFPSGAEGLMETRSISSKGKTEQVFWERPQFPETAFEYVKLKLAEADHFVSVAPRVRKSGTKRDVELVYVLWVDLDSESGLVDLAEFPLEPSAVIATGTKGHCHAYWGLQEPVDVPTAERLNRALVAALGGDRACVDGARMMRIPGTYNWKHSPPALAELVSWRDRRFSFSEIEEGLPPGATELPPSAPTVEGDSRWPRTEDPVARVLDRLEEVRSGGNGWMALCPAHDDTRPSLSVSAGEDGRCLVHCFAGCDPDEVVASIGLRMSDLTAGGVRGREASGKASTQLVRVVEENGVELFHDAGGAGFAAFEVEGHRETWGLSSSGFALWLRKLAFEVNGDAIGDEALKTIVATLEAKALFDGEERAIHRRVARNGERIFLDLTDSTWRAVEVTVSGWSLCESPPVHFVRSPTAQPLPAPVEGGSLEDLRRFTNCADEPSWKRLCGSLVMCLNADGPFPVIYPTGEQGSAKSTLSRLIFSLVDPNVAPLQMGSPTVRDLAVIANSVWLVGFDNVSRVSRNLSDALCQLATGGGFRTRKLYADTEVVALDLKRPVLLNGIGRVLDRPDLLDRVALVELEPIAPEQRRTEADLLADWETTRPLVLGAILDGVSAALAGVDEVELEGFPRMADFARWIEAAGSAFGWAPGEFTRALEQSRKELLDGSAEANPEVFALLAFMDHRTEWKGSATELLGELAKVTDVKTSQAPAWPERPDELSVHLVEHAPLLRTYGIEIERDRHPGGQRSRFLRVTKAGDTGTRGDAL